MELDQQLGGRSTLDLAYESEYQALQSGYVGAVQNEVLRLYSPVQFIMRDTITTTTLYDTDGDSHLVPKDILCLINIPAAFHNSKIWGDNNLPPAQRHELHNSPACDFNPSRWLRTNKDSKAGATGYWPFGQGVRACLGKAFALVEMTAVLSTIFTKHSMELVVSQQTLQSCNGDYQSAWHKTKDDALRTLVDDIDCNITIYLSKALPIRLIDRGGSH